ncbi:MAG: DUF4097 domain-containing protein [Planctomycetes bacterium]|jgi:DUF4097 and DUF4098 domain-containing protein YvlB|nr:DUF4097 domain-containing protein [Planctomycetota bacterium]
MTIRPTITRGVVLGLTALLLGGCIIHTRDFKAKFHRSEDLTAPVTNLTALHVSTNVGKIHLDAADVTEVRIVAEIEVKAPTEEKAQQLAEDTRIVVEQSSGTLTIEVDKPPDLGRNQLSVDFTITAPPALALTCKANVGEIRVAGFTQAVKARTDVGDVACTGLRGEIDLHTNVGSLRAAYAEDAPAALRATMKSNVGDVEFAGPTDLSVHLAAAANVGSIHTDRPLTVRGSLKQSLQASLGKAEGQVELYTNVGSIKIR